MLDKNDIIEEFKSVQDEICTGIEALDQQGQFLEDKWSRPEGGGGRTRIITGQHIEKGGVNFSAVSGTMPDKICKALGIDPTEFVATGVSIVLHPSNPHMPIIHMNVRYFETTSGLWWFGGGIDLTPHYVDKTLAAAFHNKLKVTCDKHDQSYYPKYKKWADDYFYVKHRKETRGVGGIFFDRIDKSFGSKQSIFNYVIDVAKTFLPIYKEQFYSQHDKSYNEKEREWQLHRRGRYVEFNLVWDRGTKFGLDTDGNIESILMSLPPDVRWTYRYPYNDEEQATLDLLKKEIDWLAFL